MPRLFLIHCVVLLQILWEKTDRIVPGGPPQVDVNRLLSLHGSLRFPFSSTPCSPVLKQQLSPLVLDFSQVSQELQSLALPLNVLHELEAGRPVFLIPGSWSLEALRGEAYYPT